MKKKFAEPLPAVPIKAPNGTIKRPQPEEEQS